ncbi:YvrJ family protein [Priestia aryabhattai]|uniref:YvrJ family protein n=1 Tax=Priestia aryabhattai TaxID=412384 RepID=UPI001CCA4048|nr:YvrJ family protein [Priestia aryabhattai]MBZ6484841.1 YvrJ family protein [Priestia aryabhattai]MED4154350.1 YvrJ family protein [Priestia aryabhattai]
MRRYVIIVGDLVSFIEDVGFPIILSLYLLVRLESKLDKITKLLQIIIGKKDKP